MRSRPATEGAGNREPGDTKLHRVAARRVFRGGVGTWTTRPRVEVSAHLPCSGESADGSSQDVRPSTTSRLRARRRTNPDLTDDSLPCVLLTAFTNLSRERAAADSNWGGDNWAPLILNRRLAVSRSIAT